MASLYPRFCHHVALPHACLCPNVPLIHESTIRWVTSHVTPVHLHPNCISTDPISNQGHIWRYCPLGLQHRILRVGWTQINTIPHPFPQRLANTPCFLSLCLLWTFPINGIPSVVAFCVWLLSLNTVFRPCCSMCQGFIHLHGQGYSKETSFQTCHLLSLAVPLMVQDSRCRIPKSFTHLCAPRHDLYM